LGLVSATFSSSGRKGPSPKKAPLLPKLRGQFAEFLNQGYLDRLGILYLSTCVGLGYGHHRNWLEAFLGSMGSSASPQAARHCISELTAPRIFLGGPPTCLPHVDQRVGPTTLLRHPIAPLAQWVGRPRRASLSNWGRGGRVCGGTGISTSCPSPTPVGLGLGPDLPWAD
jgi:hypothetical protein